MSKRRRPSPRRAVWLLFVLLLILFLWNLNQWLPGSWPGGGGGGSLASPQPATSETERDESERTETRLRDAGRVKKGDTRPKWQRQGVTVEVRAFDGKQKTQWHLGIGDGGSDHRPNKDGTWQATDKQIFEEGFRVRDADALVRHHFGTRRPASKWAVYMPSRTIETQRLQPGTVEVQVVSEDRSHVVSGVHVSAFRPGALEPAVFVRTDSGGRAKIERQRGVVRLIVEGKDAQDRAWYGEAWADARDREPVTLRVRRAGPVQISWWPIVQVREARVRASDGTILATAVPPKGTKNQFAMERPDRSVRNGRVELVFALGGATYERSRPVPADFQNVGFKMRDRTVIVTASGPNGPLSGAAITAYYAPSDPEGRPLEARAFTDAKGRARLVLPEATSARAMVEAGGMAPAVVELPVGQREAAVRLGPGVSQRVRVVGKDGGTTESTVLLRMSVGGLRLERSAITSKDGVATFEGLPEDDAEVLAHARGMAWGTTAIRTNTADTQLTLEPGHGLVLTVATPRGFPVPHARADLVLVADDAIVTDPRRQAFESGADGMLEIPALPRRAYRVRVTAPGYRMADVRGLVPGDTTHFVTLIQKKAK